MNMRKAVWLLPIATVFSVNLFEDLCPECPLKDVDLPLVDLLSLNMAPGQHQLSKEILGREHSLESICKLLETIKFLIIL